MQEAPCQFEIGVCDAAGEDGVSDKPRRNVRRPFVLPHDWRVGGVAHLRCELGTWKPDASCSLTQSIMVPCHHRGQGYKFGNARGSHRDVRVHPTEVVKGVVHTFAKGNPIF